MYYVILGEQGWRSGESTRLPPLWRGFKSRCRRHMWVEFVVGSLPYSERFFSGYSGLPLSSKTNISIFQFDQESGRRRTTMWMCYLQIVIYLFILFIYLIKVIRSKAPKESRQNLFRVNLEYFNKLLLFFLQRSYWLHGKQSNRL